MVNRRLNDFYHRHPSLISLLVLLVVVIPGYVVIKHQADCIDNWANGYQGRSDVVLRAATNRQNALDGFLRSLSTSTPPKLYVDLRNYIISNTPEQQQTTLAILTNDTTKYNKPALDALQSYKHASDHYNVVLAKHPLAAVGRKLNC